MKKRFNKIKSNNLYFFRDNSGHEVDCLADQGTFCIPIEIKISQTINETFFRNLDYYNSMQPSTGNSFLIYGGTDSYSRNAADVVSYCSLHNIKL